MGHTTRIAWERHWFGVADINSPAVIPISPSQLTNPNLFNIALVWNVLLVHSICCHDEAQCFPFTKQVSHVHLLFLKLQFYTRKHQMWEEKAIGKTWDPLAKLWYKQTNRTRSIVNCCVSAAVVRVTGSLAGISQLWCLFVAEIRVKCLSLYDIKVVGTSKPSIIETLPHEPHTPRGACWMEG